MRAPPALNYKLAACYSHTGVAAGCRLARGPPGNGGGAAGARQGRPSRAQARRQGKEGDVAGMGMGKVGRKGGVRQVGHVCMLGQAVVVVVVCGVVSGCLGVRVATGGDLKRPPPLWHPTPPPSPPNNNQGPACQSGHLHGHAAERGAARHDGAGRLLRSYSQPGGKAHGRSAHGAGALRGLLPSGAPGISGGGGMPVRHPTRRSRLRHACLGVLCAMKWCVLCVCQCCPFHSWLPRSGGCGCCGTTESCDLISPPLGALAMATLHLARETHARVFSVTQPPPPPSPRPLPPLPKHPLLIALTNRSPRS